MLFKFNKYISPNWYYNISTRKSDKNVFFVDYRSLSKAHQDAIVVDTEYSSQDATLCDAAFQILQKGIFDEYAKPLQIIYDKDYIAKVRLFGDKNVFVNRGVAITDKTDNYRFVRRFYGSAHASMILAMRLLSLHNPFTELSAFIETRNVKKVPLYMTNGFMEYQKKYESFDSDLIRSNPKVSIIIPTLNRYEYLKDVMIDLENQDYKNFEVIIVDQSEPFNEDFYKGWNLDLKYYHQEEKALWLARNFAIKSATGEYILLYDDDSRVEPDWIRQHLKCIDYFKCDISSGVSLSMVGAKIPEDYAYFKWSAQLDTGNVLFSKQMMNDTGMFDRQFEKQRMGDGEFGLRSYLCGKTNISNPYAKRIHLKVQSGGLRQMGAWDAFQNAKIFAPKPIPSVLYLVRKYFGNNVARVLLAFSVPFTLLPYKYKGSNKMKVVSLLLFILFSPLAIIPVIRSWNQASVKLQQGNKIGLL